MSEFKDNLSLVLHKKGDLRLEQTPVPRPKDDEVLIGMSSVGICGSDIHYYIEGHIGHFVVKEPMILGHESSGTVVEVGSEVKHLKPGDRVAIEPQWTCRKCSFCKSGRYNLCPDVSFCATPPIDGTLRRFYTHPADFCFKLPEHVSLEEGALLEPLSVAVHACRRAEVTFGKKVLVCGSGPIGLVNMMAAKAMGATAVCVTDINVSRLAVAKILGADAVVAVDDADMSKVAAKIEAEFGCQPDIVIECSGAESSVQLSILAVKPGGVIVIVGVGPTLIKVPTVTIGLKELDVRGIFRYANCYPLALEMVASGKVNVKPLITHRFKLSESVEAFETSRTAAGGAIKVMIHCDK